MYGNFVYKIILIMEGTVKERLRAFIKAKGISERQFCLSAGVSTSFVSNMVTSLKPDKLLKIAGAFPELNTDWLLTGHGDMLKDNDVHVELPNDGVKQRLLAYIKAKGLKKHQFEKKCGLSVGYVANIRSSISPEKMKSITSVFPDLNVDWLITGRGTMFNEGMEQEQYQPVDSPVKQRLKDFIKVRGISERQFCLSSGLSTSFVSSIRKSILPETVELIEETYPELNTGWLLTGKGAMFNDDIEQDQFYTTSIKQRVSEYCNYKNIAISKFESLAGISNGYFNNIKKRPSVEKIEQIHSAFPDLNTDWLLTGRGSMFAEDSVIQPEESNEQPDIEKELIQLRQEKQELLNTVMRLNERITCLNDTITRLNMQIHDMMFSGESSRHDAV